MPTTLRPMPLLRAREPFDHAEWLFELKHDGFRALAIIEGRRCRLVSRNGHDLRWPQLAEEIAHSVRARHAVLDGEIVCLKADGGSDFYSLMFRRERPYFYAFDALSVEGRDIRQLPLLARKRALRRIMPRMETRLRYVDHLAGQGRDLFRLVCERDAEGIVAKWRKGTYHTDSATTSWLKIKNPALCRCRHKSGYAAPVVMPPTKLRRAPRSRRMAGRPRSPSIRPSA